MSKSPTAYTASEQTGAEIFLYSWVIFNPKVAIFQSKMVYFNISNEIIYKDAGLNGSKALSWKELLIDKLSSGGVFNT